MNLTELLDDLADAAPPPALAPGPLWAAGRRRRRARRVRAAGAVVAVLGVLAVLLPAASVPVTPTFARSSSSAGVDGYPERIGRQWVVRDLPERPGPLAAVLQVRGEDGGPVWQAVRSDGHRWRLPGLWTMTDLYPTLSPDGRLLGYLASGEGPYVVRDLVTGGRTSFDDLGDNVLVRSTTYGLFGQHPSHWSPDGRLLQLAGFERLRPRDRLQDLVLDVRVGTITPLDRVGFTAGWGSPDRLVRLDDTRQAPQPGSTVDVVQTDLDGREVSREPLAPRQGPPPPVSQWTGRISADGLLSLLPPEGGDDGVRVFTLEGAEVRTPSAAVSAAFACGTTWRSPGLVSVPVLQPDGTLLVVDALEDRLVRRSVVAPQLGASCVVWADQALSGTGRGAGVLGRSSAVWTWFWRELLLGGLALAAVTALVVRRRRSVARPAAGAVDWYA